MATLFPEAFGRLSGPPTIDPHEEDLYSVFLNRSELMGWGSPSGEEHPMLWAMEEAELNPVFDTGPTRTSLALDPNCIGFVQVGLQRRNGEDAPFEFGDTIAAHGRLNFKTSSYRASPQLDTGVSVKMPEWTPSAIGWTLAEVIGVARSIEPNSSDFVLRIARA